MNREKKIIILHEAISPAATADEQDTLVQMETIRETLRMLGYVPVPHPVTLNLSGLQTELASCDPFLVFNIVESLESKGRYIHFVPGLLEESGIPFTGSGESALFLTTSKLLSKQVMLQNGIATPEWQTLASIDENGLSVPLPCIIKPVREDASKDISDNSVLYTQEQYAAAYGRFHRLNREDCFVERYVEGREINIALLANRGFPEVLPPAEITFEQFPPHKPRIVNYNAKWCPDSFEYHHTPRTFDFARGDRTLLNKLKNIACRCWECFGLRGYARVDFRVDVNNKPWVIDINANPCLSPDSGFVASACTAGYTYEGVVTRILDEAYFHPPCSRRRQTV